MEPPASTNFIFKLVVGSNAEGVFFAQPVTLDSESDSDVDTDDAQTVIFKSSPYSSPGPGIQLRNTNLFQ